MDSPSSDHGIHFAEADDGWTFRSYSDLAADAHAVAGRLRQAGARPGEVAALLVSEPRDFAPAFLGVQLAGLTPSPIASPLTFQGSESYDEHVISVLRVASAGLVVADTGLADTAARCAATVPGARAIALGAVADLPATNGGRVDPAEIQLLQMTSGSSGTPKGVRVTGENLAANISSIHRWLGVTPEDSCSSWLPLYHDMGLIGTFLGSVSAQIDLWLMSPIDFLRSPLRWLGVHGREGVSVTTSPNFGYSYAVRRTRPESLTGMDFSGWRAAMNGAERIDPRAAAEFTQLLQPFGFRASVLTPCYGMAEATLAVTGVRPGEGSRTVRVEDGLRPGEAVTVASENQLGATHPSTGGSYLASCGRPVPEAEVAVVDETGTALPEGHFGEIRVSGTGVAAGYTGAPEATSSRFTAEGLLTGDSGFLLAGELYVVGRTGDSLKVRGRKVHAEDLEAKLTALEGIKAGRCAVALGATGGRQHVVAVVQSSETSWLDPLLSVVRSATDEAITVTVVRSAKGGIPRTSSGKPRRSTIWRHFLEADLPGELVHGRLPEVTTAGR